MREKLPLKGIKILDLTRLIPGAICTLLLADSGAEIIKVEEPKKGDYERDIPPFINGMASRFLLLNRNKKSIAIDLKKDKGKEIFLNLVEKADVLVEGFRPGVMKKLGLDYNELKKVNEKLIYCSISSFGHYGPNKDIVAHDLNILALSGYFHVSGGKNKGEAIPGIQIVDVISGIYAALGIILALIARENSGEGQYIDISMYDSFFSLMFDAVRYYFAEKNVPEGGKGRLNGGLSTYNIYETKDGKYISVASLETKFKNKLLEKMGKVEFIEDNEITSYKIDEKDKELRKFLQKMFLTKNRDDWMNEFKRLNICITPVYSIEEAINDENTIKREMVVDATHPKLGKIKYLGFPIKFSNIKINVSKSLPAPERGEHTLEILRDMGFSEKEIKILKEQKIISTN